MMKKGIFFKILNFILDIFWQKDCIFCNRIINKKGKFEYICKECQKNIIYFERSFGKNLEEYFSSKSKFLYSSDDKKYWQKQKFIALFDGPIRQLIHSFKYYEALFLKNDIKALINDFSFFENAILVPVPIHYKKLTKRGYNQSYIIAKIIEENAKFSKLENLLRRDVFSIAQISLTKNARIKNVKGAFCYLPNCPLDAEKRYILIDDVFTTGSTLNECAKILYENGARKIDIFTLARK